MANSISEAKYNELSKSEKRGFVKEWSCKCNECKKKWHYLDEIERKMKNQEVSNALTGCFVPCFSPFTSNKVRESEKQRKELSSCPKCGSANVVKTAKFYK